MHTTQWIGLGAAVLAVALMPGAARAQVAVTITPTITADGGGVNTFAYTLQDTGSSTLGEFQLNVPDSTQLTNVMSPAGWAIFPGSTTNVDWYSTASSFDIAPGSSLSGFSFDDALPAGSQGYFVQSYDDNSTATGTTQGPVPATAPVPEASSVVSLGLLLMLGMGGVAVARKKAKASAA